MAKYNGLASVAHNLGHSDLSLMNYVSDDYIVEHLFRRAREAGETHGRIDVLRGTIEPAAFHTSVLVDSVARKRAAFGRLVQTGGAALDMVSAARMEIVFALAATRPSPIVPGLELAALDEYGVPLQVGLKRVEQLVAAEDLDTALARLRALRLDELPLTPFEREFVADAQQFA